MNHMFKSYELDKTKVKELREDILSKCKKIKPQTLI